MNLMLSMSRRTARGRTTRPRPISRVCRLCIIIALFEITAGAALASSQPPLASVVIRGSTVYTAAGLFDTYRDHVGRPITRELAESIAAALVERYRNDGHPRPQIRVADGLTDAGVLRLQVFEARILDVAVDGDPGPYRAALERLGAQVGSGDQVRQEQLHALLRRMRALPGLTVSSRTEPHGAQPNAYRLDLDTRFDRVTGTVQLTNRGTKEIGPNFILGQVVGNGLFGGRASVGLLFGGATDRDEYRGLGALTSVALTDGGLRARLTGFRSRAQPSGRFAGADVKFLRDRVTLKLDKPLTLASVPAASVSAALEFENLAIERATVALRDERLRVLELGFRMHGGTPGATQSATTLELVKGLGGFGSGLDARDIANDLRREDFLLVRFDFTRLAHLGESWSWRIDTLAQQTNYTLPYSRRFKIGGERLGRGYEVAAVAGDQGVGAKVELQRHLKVAPAALERATAYTFYDIGAAWRHDAPGRESAATAGVGLRIRTQRTSTSIEATQPLTNADASGRREASVFVEATVRL